MAGKHISIPALLKIGAGALDNLGIYLKELQLQKESSCIVWKRSCRNVWFYRYGSIAAGGH